jgi:hypothetical protein
VGICGIIIIIIIVIIIFIIIIIILVTTFMHGIYNYVPVSGICSVAAVLYLQFVLHVMLFRP